MSDPRAKAIETIECTYAADSQHLTIAQTGQRLLEQARHEFYDWRREPTHVLERYAELCIEEMNRCAMMVERRR